MAVIGMPGAGKSTIATALGRAIDAPVFHLDEAYWAPGRDRFERADFDAHVRGLIALPSAVVDGNYSAHLFAERLARADAVVLAKVSRRVALWRVVRRALWQRRRPGHGGNPAGIDREFVAFIWHWERNHRGFEETVRRLAGDAPVILVRSTADAADVVRRATPGRTAARSSGRRPAG